MPTKMTVPNFNFTGKLVFWSFWYDEITIYEVIKQRGGKAYYVSLSTIVSFRQTHDLQDIVLPL